MHGVCMRVCMKSECAPVRYGGGTDRWRESSFSKTRRGRVTTIGAIKDNLNTETKGVALRTFIRLAMSSFSGTVDYIWFLLS